MRNRRMRNRPLNQTYQYVALRNKGYHQIGDFFFVEGSKDFLDPATYEKVNKQINGKLHDKKVVDINGLSIQMMDSKQSVDGGAKFTVAWKAWVLTEEAIENFEDFASTREQIDGFQDTLRALNEDPADFAEEAA